ncbi:transposase [Acuticoccus sp.]|uniref:transposase n=1 Tax=Acuticoccus sp. TaxID=1904378 RepID=UPI003B5228E6
MARYDLSEVEWSVIEPLLPLAPPGWQRADDRRGRGGMFWVPRTGSSWRGLPSRDGPSTTVDNCDNGLLSAGSGWRSPRRSPAGSRSRDSGSTAPS